MSRTRRRNWFGYWRWSRYCNLFLYKIFKERGIAKDDWEAIDKIKEKSLPNILFFGKVFSDYHGSYKWVKKYENKRYRQSQKQKLKEDFEAYEDDKIVKDIDFYYGD